MRRRTALQPGTEGRATAFPSGDLPEPPGGPKEGRPEKRRNGGRLAFSAAGGKSRPALHRETKCSDVRHPPLRCGPLGAPLLRPRPGIAVKAAMPA